MDPSAPQATDVEGSDGRMSTRNGGRHETHVLYPRIALLVSPWGSKGSDVICPLYARSSIAHNRVNEDEQNKAKRIEIAKSLAEKIIALEYSGPKTAARARKLWRPG